MALNYSLDAFVRVFETACSSATEADNLSGNPQKWGTIRGIKAVLDLERATSAQWHEIRQQRDEIARLHTVNKTLLRYINDIQTFGRQNLMINETPEQIAAKLTQALQRMHEATIEVLKHAICTVEFTKKNGETRTMRATLIESYLPPKKEGRPTRQKTPTLEYITVWDVDKNEWRQMPTLAAFKSIESGVYEAKQ